MVRKRSTICRVAPNVLAACRSTEKPTGASLRAAVDVAEEERLVLHDRTADADAALLVLERRRPCVLGRRPRPTQSWLRPK